MTYNRDVDVYEREDTDDTYAEREGTGVGTIIGIILAVVVVLAIVWFFFLGGMNSGANTTAPDQNLDNNVTIEQPAPADNTVPQY